MSHVVIVGGTGYAGSHIAAEAVSRGHHVTSYSRHLPQTPIDGVDYRTGSITDPEVIKKKFPKGHKELRPYLRMTPQPNK